MGPGHQWLANLDPSFGPQSPRRARAAPAGSTNRNPAGAGRPTCPLCRAPRLLADNPRTGRRCAGSTRLVAEPQLSTDQGRPIFSGYRYLRFISRSSGETIWAKADLKSGCEPTSCTSALPSRLRCEYVELHEKYGLPHPTQAAIDEAGLGVPRREDLDEGAGIFEILVTPAR